MMHKIVDGVQVPLSPEEIAEFQTREAEHESKRGERKLADIRSKRNALLAATDIRMLPDVPGDKEALKVYRQALRDVTKQPDLDNIVWPKEV